MKFKSIEELPETDKPVTVTDGEIYATALYSKFGYWVPVGVKGYPSASLSLDMEDVTHWAELPELPKKEGKQ